MTRREFLAKSGTVAAAFAASIGKAGKVVADSREPSVGRGKGKRPDPDMFPQPVMKAIAPGINAPNPLAQFIMRRQTGRLAHTGGMLADSEFQTLIGLSGKQHSEVLFCNRDPSGLLDLLYEAFAVESRTYATNEETRRWFRFSEAERREKGDGSRVPQGGVSGLAKIFAEASLKGGDEKTRHGEKAVEGSLKNFRKGLEISRGIVIRKHPEMDALRGPLNSMMGVREPQKIRMIVRVGRSAKPYCSYRRNVDDFLIA